MLPRYTASSQISKVLTKDWKHGSQSVAGHLVTVSFPTSRLLSDETDSTSSAGPTQQAFSKMSSTAANRAAFINGAIKFMDTYGFDGVDLDWEYPAAEDRSGLATDFENYVTLLQEMRSSFGSKYGLTITIPTSYWYLQHFDVTNLQDSVDWFNLMSYDLHGESIFPLRLEWSVWLTFARTGTWDAQSIYTGPYIMPHTNITEIDEGLDLLWRAGVSPDKVTMGLACKAPDKSLLARIQIVDSNTL